MSDSAASRPLKIALSACFMHPDPARASYGPKTLHFVEQATAHWVMAGGALPVMVPPTTGATARGPVKLQHYAEWLDGLILHGGADVSPHSYGEQPLRPEWAGDAVRDDYERALIDAFVALGKPVLGICRGLQMLNVAFGGSLYQDILTQLPSARAHVDSTVFDRHFHPVELVTGSRLAEVLSMKNNPNFRDSTPQVSYLINSIHHQGIKDLAPQFEVEARCPQDGVIEAVRWKGPSFVAGVQWHPEFHLPADAAALGVIDDSALLDDFLQVAQQVRGLSPP
ncbi:MAG: hypothetical protein RLZZ126_1636 [Pseudomonadota bacterium]|jgi:putative glutamine amidotransferase